MNKEQAEKWLVDNGFYSEYDKPSSETHLAEAAISVNDEHVDIVMKLTEEKKRTISLEAYLKMQCDVAQNLELQPFNGVPVHVRAKYMIDALLKHNNVVVEGE